MADNTSPDRGRLQAKVACVTGSNSGLGRAMALGLAAEGARVICASRQEASKDPEEAFAATHHLILERGGVAEYVNVQVCDSQSVDQLVRHIVGTCGRLDIMINNAGASQELVHRQKLWDKSNEMWQSTLDVNLTSKFYCTRAASAQMIKQEPDADGCRGKIINISSIAGVNGLAHHVPGYVASQHGTIGLTRSAALDCAPYGINVNAICPGSVRTQLNAMLFDGPAELRAARAATYPLGFGRPSDIAAAAVYLASADARWVTGQHLIVDGGYSVP